MSLKTASVKVAKKVLPRKQLRRLRANYRVARARTLGARYGHPAKKLKIIAITGTNGKTTTANYINEILKTAGQKTSMFSTAIIEIAGKREPNQLNLTVPPVATLQKFFRASAKQGVEYCIIEATSQALDQKKFLGVPIFMAVMTNLTQDHLDYHHDMQHYATAKSNIFRNKPTYIVLNRDDEYFDYFNRFQPKTSKVSYGRHSAADFHINHSILYRSGAEAFVSQDRTHFELATYIPGEFNVYNMAAAAAACSLLGIPAETIADGIAELDKLPGRYEVLQTDTPYSIVVDYAHTPDALRRLLKSARETSLGRVILVFGCMGERDRTKRSEMGKIANEFADIIFVTDEENDREPRAKIRAEIITDIKNSPKVTEIDGREHAIHAALAAAKKNDTILITGLGHETYHTLDGKRIPWSDQKIVKKLLSN